MIGEMLCLVLGDSNALKVAPYRPNCENVSVKGLDSNAIRAMAPPDKGYTLVIVSMGTNDHAKSGLPDNLGWVRHRYRSARFAWIAPVAPIPGGVVADFAASHHDVVVRLADFPNRGGHPNHPEDVARALPE